LAFKEKRDAGLPDPDVRRFLFHSLGSVNELEYDLLLAKDLGRLPATHHARVTGQLEEVRRMLSSLVQTLTPWRRRTEPGWPLEAGSFGG